MKFDFTGLFGFKERSEASEKGILYRTRLSNFILRNCFRSSHRSCPVTKGEPRNFTKFLEHLFKKTPPGDCFLCFKGFTGFILSILHKKLSFPLRISSVNVTKLAVS